MMKRPALNRVICLLILLLFSFSCASDLDYEQANDLKLEPIFVANLVYFDVPANEFVTSGVEQSVILDAPTVDVFSEKFFTEKLIRVNLFFKIENTITRDYVVDLEFLDNGDQVVHTINITVPAYSGAENIVTKTEIFENTQLDLLKQTVRIAFKLQMLPGAPLLTNNSLGNLKLQSSVTANFIVE